MPVSGCDAASEAILLKKSMSLEPILLSLRLYSWFEINIDTLQERKRHINTIKFLRWLPGWGGVSRPDGQRSPDRWPGVRSLCAVCGPHEHKRFRPGTRPGGSVTGVTEELFMCQMFMCLFRPLTLPFGRPWGVPKWQM